MSGELKIKVGHSYRTRDGRKATVVKRTDHMIFPIRASVNGGGSLDFTNKGRFYSDNITEHPTDFIAPWDEDLNPVFDRQQTLAAALDCVTRNRNVQYGEPEDCFGEIAKRWSLHLGAEVRPHDVAVMLIDLKLVRLKTSPQKADNWIDVAGYAACGAETAKAKA